MTSSSFFFGILFFIVMAKGILQFNEPFLVALCFLGFVWTVYTKLGSDIYNLLNSRYEAMVSYDRDYIKKYRGLLKEVVDLYKSRVSLYRRLHRMGKFFKAQTRRYIEFRETELENQVNQYVVNQLELTSQKEMAFRNQFQQELVTKFINQLKDQAQTKGLTIKLSDAAKPLTVAQLERFLTTLK